MPSPSRWVYVAVLVFVAFLAIVDSDGAGSNILAGLNWLKNVVVSIPEFLGWVVQPRPGT